MNGRREPQRKSTEAKTAEPLDVGAIIAELDAGKPVRRDLEGGGRVHVDRALPFVCVYIGTADDDLAARDVAMANASYLITPDTALAETFVLEFGSAMRERFGGFILLDVGELARDALLTEDAPYLPPFEILVSETKEAESPTDAFIEAVEAVEPKFRVPQVVRLAAAADEAAALTRLDFPAITVRFAPIYRQPEGEGIYPALRERVVANIYDAGLKAFAAFAGKLGTLDVPTHRAFGRQVFVEAVRRADRAIDEIASSFDFLLAVTPINAQAAWAQFEEGGFERAPRLLYRPLAVRVDEAKRKLFSIPFDHFEDPVLNDLYRQKQQELDLQLSLIASRETTRFREMGRALYGSVRPPLLKAAHEVLEKTADRAGTERNISDADCSDCYAVRASAVAMIERYRQADERFAAKVELRDDLPSGLMVSGPRLLISRTTKLWNRRVEALLSHEIGVHLLTYVNGSAQGLWLFRSGLAGYEGVQEGLAVFAEYLVGGMTVRRLRLIAARVIACAAMLDGAAFRETFALLVEDHDFSGQDAFGICLRVYRSGGLAKDAIYLRGLYQVLDHLKGGGALEPFWMGKIAARHFPVMQELGDRGLLQPPAVAPLFLTHPEAGARLEKARAGLSPADMAA